MYKRKREEMDAFDKPNYGIRPVIEEIWRTGICFPDITLNVARVDIVPVPVPGKKSPKSSQERKQAQAQARDGGGEEEEEEERRKETFRLVVGDGELFIQGSWGYPLPFFVYMCVCVCVCVCVSEREFDNSFVCVRVES